MFFTVNSFKSYFCCKIVLFLTNDSTDLCCTAFILFFHLLVSVDIAVIILLFQSFQSWRGGSRFSHYVHVICGQTEWWRLCTVLSDVPCRALRFRMLKLQSVCWNTRKPNTITLETTKDVGMAYNPVPYTLMEMMMGIMRKTFHENNDTCNAQYIGSTDRVTRYLCTNLFSTSIDPRREAGNV